MSSRLEKLLQLGRRLPRSRRAIAAGLAGVALAGCGLAVGTNAWIDHLALPHIHSALDGVPHRQVAIVPGALVYSDGTPSTTLRDRLTAALELHRAGKVEKILVSGDHATVRYDEVNAMGAWLRARKVPAADVFLDHAGLRTLDTMTRARQVFAVESAVICTQRFHLPRSVFLARQAGIDAVGLVADRRRYVHHRKNQVREFVAKSVSFADSYLFHTAPRHGGRRIPITGDGRATHDRWSR